MIRFAGSPEAPVPRLVRALAALGWPVGDPGSERDGESADTTWLLGPGDGPAAVAGLGPGPGRLLVIGFLGTHPDAQARELRQHWDLEEASRESGRRPLVLRLAPLLGPESPLWLKLREHGPLPRGGRTLLQPVAEEDVVGALVCALEGRAAWSDWHEVVGPETWTLAELADLACRPGLARDGRRGAWEPRPEVLAEQRLGEAAQWTAHFGVQPGSVSERALTWAA